MTNCNIINFPSAGGADAMYRNNFAAAQDRTSNARRDAKIIDINKAAINKTAAKADADAKAEALRKFTSWKMDWMRAVRCHPLVASTDARIAETVAQHINQHSLEARLRIETIGDEINKSGRTVSRSLANLKGLGLLEWKRRANKSSVFWLLDDKIKTIAERHSRLRDIRKERRQCNAL